MNERLERIDGLLAASLVEIAELLGVSKQRPYQIVDEPGFPAPIERERPQPAVEPARGHGVAKTWRAQKP